MWVWLGVIAFVVVVGFGLWRLARHANSVEDDTAYLMEGGTDRPYGSTWLAILRREKDT